MEPLKRKLDRDKRLVQHVVRNYGPVSRSKIHELTKIRRSAISVLVQGLQKEGRILEAGRVSDRTGRKQVLLRLNEEHGFVAAVEFDEDTVTAGATDLKPRLRHRITEPTNLSEGSQGLIRQLIACIKRAIKEAGISASSLIGVGVADPGMVDSRRGVTVISSTIDFWKDVPVKQLLEDEFHVPVAVETKTRAKAVAEQVLGAGSLAENMVYVDYGAGIGAAVILDGKLRYGANCALGEFGHTHTADGGPACKCGSFGCLEAVAGARAVEAKYRQSIEQAGLSYADRDDTSVWMLLKRAAAGDKICSNMVAEVGRSLGLGLANLVNLFNPSMVVLDSRLRLAGPGLLDQVTHMVKRQALTYTSEHAALRFGELGDESGVLGVALIILNSHFEIPSVRLPKLALTEGSTASAYR
jgi:N-acetylglucosamine repressor